MNSKQYGIFYNNLIKAVSELKNEDEAAAFFDDLCTIAEIKAMSARLEVSRQLKEGRVYSDIARDTGASTATISRVNRCLQYGSGGYNIILERLANENV